MIIGIDTGGTFTDFVTYANGRFRIHKVLSTPHAPEKAILRGLSDMGVDASACQIVHGSTVATNAALEGKGVKVVFITNRGFADMLTLGRQARREIYNLQPDKIAPPVAPELCLETGGRVDAQGELLEALTESDIQQLCDQVEALQPEAIAINLLFSFLDERHEKAIEAALPESLFVSRSSRVLPEYGEYERGISTWLNAWVGPLMQRYLQCLCDALGNSQVSVMQSSGGTISADKAGAEAVRLLLSGPAGGLTGAKFIAQACDRERLLTFDMGGTSTDVALIDGDIQLTSDGYIAGYPVAVPMVDMHTIGAGGGSIASLDAGGALQVGPESAGAIPGPACYGQGGIQPTVTDANLVLGRLREDAFLGGDMQLDSSAAHKAVEQLALASGCSVVEAAEGIIRLANEHMAAALRVISVQRGVDPRGFSLVAFGGAGGLHVCALADALGMTEAIVPVYGGVLSALGMMAAGRSRELSVTLTGLVSHFSEDEIEAGFSKLVGQGQVALQQEGLDRTSIVCRCSVDVRYQGQTHVLRVGWDSLAGVSETFHLAHETRYGHRLNIEVEIVNLRVSLQGPAPNVILSDYCSGSDVLVSYDEANVTGTDEMVPLYDREALPSAYSIQGPCLITEQVSTTYVALGWSASAAKGGSIFLLRDFPIGP